MKSRSALHVIFLIAAYNAAWAAADEPLAVVPFELFRNSIIVQAKVGGNGPFSMLFDTGVNPSAVDLHLAREIGLPLSANGNRPSGGGNDANLAYQTALPRVDLDGLIAENVDCLAVDLSKISAALGRTIQGVLGYSFMRNRVFEIDYARHRLVFYSHSPWSSGIMPRDDPRRKFVRFRFQNDILIDGVNVDGKAVTANLDTGSNSNLQITPRAIAALGLEQEVAKATASSSVGSNGRTENRTGRIDLISIGGLLAAEPEVVFISKGTGHDDEPWEIRIGNEFLKKYTVTVDFQSLMICFESP
jgi:predicted aspartyl protease